DAEVFAPGHADLLVDVAPGRRQLEHAAAGVEAEVRVPPGQIAAGAGQAVGQAGAGALEGEHGARDGADEGDRQGARDAAGRRDDRADVRGVVRGRLEGDGRAVDPRRLLFAERDHRAGRHGPGQGRRLDRPLEDADGGGALRVDGQAELGAEVDDLAPGGRD